jgi:hypothetical protein
MIDMEDETMINMDFAEGQDDGQKGENYNPFDEIDQPKQWHAYERGFTFALMDGYPEGN